jgi:drug/metabolite transporter (DMT)-like permease
MTWFFIALLGPLLWSLCNQIDRFFLGRYFAGETLGALLIFSSLIGIVVLPVACFFSSPFGGYGSLQIAILIAAGVSGVYGIYLYLLALRDDEASLVVPFWQLIPVFGYLFGWLVLGERMSGQQLSAGLVIVVAAMVLSVDPSSFGRGLRMKWRLVGLMAASSMIFGLHAVAFKFVAAKEDFWGACFWEYAGFVVAGCFIWLRSPASRESFLRLLRPERRKDFSWIMGLSIFSEIITLIGNLATNLALLMAPVAMVLLVSSLQPAFVFLLGIVGTLLIPRFIQESLTHRDLLHKGLSIATMCAGAAMM